MPVYNAENYVKEAVDSILTQSFEDFELLLLNDGSTDASPNILEQINDSRVRIINNVKNLGLIETLNRGLKEAKGQYIARMDADDISLPKRFEKQVDFLDKHEDYVLVGTNVQLFGESDKQSELWEEDEMIRLAIYFENPMAHPSTMFRSKVISEHQIAYSSKHLHAEDWEFWHQIMKYGKVKNLSEPLLKYRLEGQNITVQNHDGLKERVGKVYRDLLSDIYSNFAEKQIENHWNLAKAKYVWNSLMEFNKELDELKSKLIAAGHTKQCIEKYFNSKNEELFYGISNVSPSDARKFAKQQGILNFEKWLYTLKKNFKK